jgi:D-alanyl-D-alanine carboxypeptidase
VSKIPSIRKPWATVLNWREFMGPLLNRRAFLALSAGTAVSAASGRLWGLGPIPMPAAKGGAEEKLDGFTAAYMRAMNAPGMTQALTDTTVTIRTAGYGFGNVELKTPVTPDHLFQIGSITKSFAALIMLQLREEGKVDLHRPVLEYLPWLPVTMLYGPITAHHLLTHTSGLPDASGIFQSDPSARHAQGYPPGAHFHYCNLGFDILGQIIQKLDARPWYQCLQARILTPLGMTATAAVITIESSARSATGYQAFFDDQVYPRQGRLVPRPPEVFASPAGSIASPAGDMARYLRMLLNRGRDTNGRIVSEESFALLSTPYIKASEFSPTASYGYGIAVDTLEGHRILRHTGGMNCFASSIHVDLDGGVAAFASINAMQGYRPTPITQYAVQLLRAEHEANPLPAAEALKDAAEIENAGNYAGAFHNGDGKELLFKADGKRLLLVHGAEEIVLQRSEGDLFLSTVQDGFSDYSLAFGRDLANSKTGKGGDGDHEKGPAPEVPVVEVAYGPDWYTNAAYRGPRDFKIPAGYGAFIGRYRSDSGDDVRVFMRKGALWLGDSPLTEIGSSLFRVGNDSWSPDTAEFLTVVDGKARLLRVIGEDCWRIEVGS